MALTDKGKQVPIFVSEPGRSQQNRLPERMRHRRVNNLDGIAAPSAIHDRVDTAETQEKRRQQLRARQAIAGYREDLSDEPEAERRHLPVGQVLSRKLRSVSAETSLMDALAQMEKHGIHHLLVETEGDIAGLIDIRWLLRMAYEAGKDTKTPVRLDMVELPAFLTATPDTDAHELARLMLAHQLDAALVLDQDNAAFGVITSSDYLRLYAEISQHEARI